MASGMSAEELLRRLIALDSSTRAGTREIADFICNYVDRPGVRVIRNRPPEGDQANLLIAQGPGCDDRSGLVLSGHMDTVPFDEPGWDTDPLALSRRGAAYVGRGVCDMKGFVALALHCFAAQVPATLRRPLMLLFTYDEEVGTLGARHFAESWDGGAPLPRAAVIGEPTSLGVVRTHKGHLRLRIELLGEPGHSAYPATGLNAIEIAARVVNRLGDLNRDLIAEAPADAAIFAPAPYASINVATIAGGTAHNVIPAACVLDLGIRLLPGMTGECMTERVRQAVQQGVEAGPRERTGEYRLDLISLSPPMRTAEAAPIHRALCHSVGQAESRGVAYASDAGWLRTLDLDCVLWGPGTIEVAHKPNESLPVAEFRRAGALLADLVREWCAGEPAPA